MIWSIIGSYKTFAEVSLTRIADGDYYRCHSCTLSDGRDEIIRWSQVREHMERHDNERRDKEINS